MAIIRCKECGNEISDKAKICPNCGYPIKETKNKKINILTIIICIFIFIFCIFMSILLDNDSASNNLKTVNTYTIGKINYSVPKELTLVENGDEHKFVINNTAVLLINGYSIDSNYKLNSEERESTYKTAINTLIGNNNTASSIEDISINNNVWKAFMYKSTNDSGETLEHMVCIFVDDNAGYFYIVSLSQFDNITDEYLETFKDVMRSITFISSDSSSKQNNSLSKITKENYDKIKNGMSKSEVISIIGEPESVSENETPGLGTMELCHFQEGINLKAIDVYFLNGVVYMKNWTEL